MTTETHDHDSTDNQSASTTRSRDDGSESAVNRRGYLQTTAAGLATMFGIPTATTAGITGLTGCLGDDDNGAGDNEVPSNNSEVSADDNTEPNGDADSTDNEESSSEDETDPVDAIDAYLAAAEDEDVDALADAIHSSSPLQAIFEADDVEFGDVENVKRCETEVIVEEAAVDDILQFENASFFFDEDELTSVLDEEEAVLVEAEIEPETAVDGDTWVLVTDDGEWTVFWTGNRDDTPDDPKEAFEDPIEDEENDVVEEIDWEFDQEDAGDLGADVQWAQVILTDSPGIEADVIRIESTIEGTEFELYGDESGAWSGSRVNVALDPDGDQIVVTAIKNDTEEIVHRVHYDP